MNKLAPGNVSSLAGSFTGQVEFMPMALVVQNNGSSILVIPVHNEPEASSENDLIIDSNDSSLDFNCVLMPDEAFTLPETAFGKNQRTIKNPLFKWICSKPEVPFSKLSGHAPPLIPASKGAKQRNLMVSSLKAARLNSWKSYFVEQVKQLPVKPTSESLNELTNLLAAQTRVQRPAGGPLAAKSSKLILMHEKPPEFSCISRQTGLNDIIRQLFKTLAQECQADRNQITLIETGDAAAVILTVLKLLKTLCKR